MILHRKLLIGVSKFMTFKWDNFSRHSADLSDRPMHHLDIDRIARQLYVTVSILWW